MRNAKKPMVVVGIPTVGHHSFFFSQFINGCSWPTSFSMQTIYAPYMEVGRARNLLAQYAVDVQAKYLLFFDEDTIGPGWGPKKLIYLMETHPEWSCAAGVYATKSIPPDPLIYQDWGEGSYWGWKVGELVPVKATGMGHTIIRVSDLERLPVERTYQDRFTWSDSAVTTVHEWFNTGDADKIYPGGLERNLWTEDMYFFRLMEKAGFLTFVDTAILCNHYDEKSNTFFIVPMDNGVAVKPDAWNREPCVCNLGAGGEYNPYEVSVDLRDDPRITYRCDISSLPPDWSEHFDVVKSNHVLEHFDFKDTETVLQEWLRIVKPGGKLMVTVPNAEWFARMILEGKLDTYLQGCIYGDQTHPFWLQEPYGGEHNGRWLPDSNQHNHHCAAFTPASLGKLFVDVLKLESVSGKVDEFQFTLVGTKPLVAPPDNIMIAGRLEETETATVAKPESALPTEALLPPEQRGDA